MKPLSTDTLPSITPGRNFYVNTGAVHPSPDVHAMSPRGWGFHNAVMGSPFNHNTRVPTPAELKDTAGCSEYEAGYREGKELRHTWAEGFRAGLVHEGVQIGASDVPAAHLEHLEQYLNGHDTAKRIKRNEAARAARTS